MRNVPPATVSRGNAVGQAGSGVCKGIIEPSPRLVCASRWFKAGKADEAIVDIEGCIVTEHMCELQDSADLLIRASLNLAGRLTSCFVWEVTVSLAEEW